MFNSITTATTSSTPIPSYKTAEWSYSTDYIPINLTLPFCTTNSATIKKAIFNDPGTIVIWSDGSKTVVKCQKGDTYNPELGLAMCIAKKYFGNKSNFNNVFKKWIPKENIGNDDEK